MGGDEPVGLCLVDASGTIIDLDEAFTQLLGLPASMAAVGRPLAELVPELSSLPEHGSHRVLRATASAVLELVCRRVAPLGHTLLVRQLVNRDNQPVVRELEAIRHQLEVIVGSSPLAIISVDREMVVTMWSRAAEQMFGWTEAELLGRPYPLVPESERETFQQLWNTVNREGVGFTAVETKRRRKNGELVEVRVHSAPLFDQRGQVVGCIALLEELTKTRALEERIRQSQKMEAVGSLAGGIAHDFNNLLAGIVGTAELLDVDDSLSHDAQTHVAEILRVIGVARDLVAGLMTFGRRHVVRPIDTDLNDCLASAAKLVRHVVGERVELDVQLGTEALPIRIDPTQFDQILINLAVNAVDAMPKGGTLEYSTKRRELATGPLSREPFACLSVRDTGVGIPADLLPRIFDPFFTTKAAGGGSGLGLANVYAVITQAGGHVEVESKLGVGTSFHLYLPLSQAVQHAPKRPVVGMPKGHERILLVEDDDVVRRSTAKLLGLLGYDVELAHNGVEALARVDAGLEVDLVLTDVRMPELGGAELAQELYIRAPTLPILFMSGNLDVDELREQVEQGHVSFLQKPASLRELAQATREILDGR
jgi:two-component system cell cycle sensor histidine kinase/response regulator CckA